MRRSSAVAWLPTLVLVLASACAASESFTLGSSPAFPYTAPVDVSLERLAVAVTIRNNVEDDLIVNPQDFALRDRDGRVYTSSPAAALADARLVRLAGGRLGLPGLLPLPSVTLRKDDAVMGFLVFDVPAGVRPTQIVFRQTDSDTIVNLPEPAPERP